MDKKAATLLGIMVLSLGIYGVNESINNPTDDWYFEYQIPNMTSTYIHHDCVIITIYSNYSSEEYADRFEHTENGKCNESDYENVLSKYYSMS